MSDKSGRVTQNVVVHAHYYGCNKIDFLPSFGGYNYFIPGVGHIPNEVRLNVWLPLYQDTPGST